VKRLLNQFGCRQKGFTFIELLVVVTVLSTLASIVIPVSASSLSLCYR